MPEIQKILDLRSKYNTQLWDRTLSDKERLIIKAKIVALGEALDILGYVDNDGSRLEELIHDL